MAMINALGLRQRAMLLIGLLVLISQVVQIAISISADSAAARETLEARAQMVAALQARSVAIPLYDLDQEQVAEVVKGPSRDPDFKASFVRDAKGAVVATVGDMGTKGDYVEVVTPVEAGATGQKSRIGEYVIRLGTARLDARIQQHAMTDLLGGGLSFLAVMGVLYLIVAAIAGPLEQFTQVVARLAAGDLSVAIPALDRKDEVGGMARAIAILKESAEERERLEAEKLARQAADSARARHLTELAARFDHGVQTVIHEVSAAADQLKSSAGVVLGNAERAVDCNRHAAGAVEASTGHAQDVNRSAADLTRSIQTIAESVQQSVRMSEQAVVKASSTRTTVETLAATAAKIGEITGLINAIAGQTNLLALNATIEAARAGEAGKGFAVVASEVKNLANQTAKATEDITSQIHAVQSVTAETVSAIAAISEIISTLGQRSAEIAGAVEAQLSETDSIAHGIGDVARDVSTVASDIDVTSKASEDVAAQARETATVAETLIVRFGRLRQEVQTFLTEIRTA